MDEANEDDRVAARPRKERRLICKDIAWLKKQYELSPQELTLDSFGRKLGKVLEQATGHPAATKISLGALIDEAGFEVLDGRNLVTHAESKASHFVTPMRLMKRAPLVAPINSRAVNFDPFIWYCDNKDLTMAGGGGKNGASNRRCKSPKCGLGGIGKMLPNTGTPSLDHSRHL